MTAFATRARIKGTSLYVDPATGDIAGRRALANYEAGSTAPRFTNWTGANRGPNAELNSVPRMIARSRYAVANDGLADGAIQTLVNNIVGTGIVPKFKTSDRALNKAARKLWDRWVKRADADGKLSFYGLQALGVRSMCEAGDVFGRLRARRLEDNLPVPLQIQLLEAEFCPHEKTQLLSDGGYIQNGIEFSKIGAPRAYWFYRSHPKDDFTQSALNQPVPVPASEVIHMLDLRRAGGARGVPWLARALIKLYELDQMDDAVLVRQKLSNMFAGFVTPDGAFFGTQDELANAVAPLAPGLMQVLPPGVKVNFNEPPGASGSYIDFVKSQQRNVARSANILYEQLTGDYSSVNDRTWRAALNEFRMGLERWQHEIVVFQFCAPVLQRWAEYAVTMLGLLKLPKGIELEDLLDVDWLPPRRPYINPVQDIQADREEVQSGFATRSQKITERGYDREDIDEENKLDMESAESRDLTYTSDGATAAKVPTLPDPNDMGGGNQPAQR